MRASRSTRTEDGEEEEERRRRRSMQKRVRSMQKRNLSSMLYVQEVSFTAIEELKEQIWDLPLAIVGAVLLWAPLLIAWLLLYVLTSRAQQPRKRRLDL